MTPGPDAINGLRPTVLLISRHTMDDVYRGNSAYVRSITAYLRANGYRVVLLIPSLRGLGRKPFARVSLDHSAFDAIMLRGGLNLGGWLVRLGPQIWLRAASAVISKLAGKLWGRRKPDRKLWDTTPVDAHELAAVRAAAENFRPDAAIANYFPLCGALDSPMLHLVPKLVIVHDVFHTRTLEFSRLGIAMPHAPISRQREIGELMKADAVVAIQEREATLFQEMLPSKRILIAPAAMPLRPAAGEPLPDTIAFVGSDNEVNQAGIQWFIAEVWPIVKARRPDAALKVYGEIGRKLGAAPAGVVIAGRVDDLTAAYHSASLCIVPLLAGSGLKVKLVEALCHGRAVVSTPVGAQGLEDLAGQAFWLADSSAAFAEAAVALLADDAQRRALEAAAIAIARDRFSAEACYGPLRRYLDEAVSSAGASPPGLRRRA